MKLGYLGPEWTFSHQAVQEYNKDLNYDIISYKNMADLIIAADIGEVDEVIVPIENSIEGPINLTLDMLAWDVELKIKAELIIPVVHCLMTKETTKDIQRILSHPQPIGQCTKFINKNFPDVFLEYTLSTSQAANIVADSSEAWAAIGSSKAANAYGLKIVYQSIEDNKMNATRFVILSKNDGVNIGRCKTSIVFSSENKPGSLYKILQILNLWEINMIRIESRPAKEDLGKYIFFVDFEGHQEETDVQDVLAMIKRKTYLCKILGSYPIYLS